MASTRTTTRGTGGDSEVPVKKRLSKRGAILRDSDEEDDLDSSSPQTPKKRVKGRVEPAEEGEATSSDLDGGSDTPQTPNKNTVVHSDPDKPYVITEQVYVPTSPTIEFRRETPKVPTTKIYYVDFKENRNIRLKIKNGSYGSMTVEKKYGKATVKSIQFGTPGVRRLYKDILLVRYIYEQMLAGQNPEEHKVNLASRGNVSLLVSPRFKGTINIADFSCVKQEAAALELPEIEDDDLDANIPLRKNVAFAFCDFYRKEMPTIFPFLKKVEQIQVE